MTFVMVSKDYSEIATLLMSWRAAFSLARSGSASFQQSSFTSKTFTLKIEMGMQLNIF